MMQMVLPLMMFMSVLFPTKLWYAPNQPIDIQIKAESPVNLVLTDFTGKAIEAKGTAAVEGNKTVNLREIYSQMSTPGTYVLWAIPKDKKLPEFVGTPLVVEVRDDTRNNAPPGPIVVKVTPLRFAQISTDMGDMTAVFYFDVAPNTAESFLSLAQAGYYDGLVFHRVVPSFVIQGGDPLGADPVRAGSGGPGYNVGAEFNAQPHLPGVLSMARQGDPIEQQGAMPRSEAANSAGSQFFICLDYEKTKQLDRRYTAFGKIVEGMDTVKKIGAVPVNDQRPVNPPAMKSVQVMAVVPGKNPYDQLMTFGKIEAAKERAAEPAGAGK